MSDVVTDERVAAVLRPFVRAAAPVLAVLRGSDPLRLRRRFRSGRREPLPGAEHGGAPREPDRMQRLLRRLDAMRLPGSSAWDAMSVEERCDWWAQRVGRVLALVAGLPNFGGVITSRLPLRNALGTAGQGLVLTAIAAEHGIDDRAVQVQLIAEVLLERELPYDLAAGTTERARELDDERAAELAGELEEERRERGRASGRAVAATVWRMARAVWEIDSELDRRPQGRFYHEAISSVPVVGVVGGYLGERSALRRVARRGATWIRRHPL